MPQVRVVGEAGQQLGILDTSEAIKQAQELGLDLVEVQPLAEPPVCKFVDYGQLQYERKKKERQQRSKQKKTEVKGLRLSTTISDHDLGIRVGQAKKFLSKGHKVQAELRLRGRQKAHPEIGKDVIDRLVAGLEADGTVESPCEQKGGKFTILIGPKK